MKKNLIKILSVFLSAVLIIAVAPIDSVAYLNDITKKEKDYIEKSIKLIGYIVDQMSDSVEFPPFTLKTIDLSEGFTPVFAAHFIRRSMGILQGPVVQICSKLESYGIIIVQLYDCDEGFDGVSFLTVHFTSDLDLFQDAKSTRRVPMTSRGGGT